MKKLFIAIALGFAIGAQAMSTSVTIASGSMTNFPAPVNGSPFKITSISVSSAGGATLKFVDTQSTALGYVVPAYTNIVSYGTNIITTWTNYYLATNSITNIAIVDMTNSVASITNAYTIPVSTTIPTNGSVVFPVVNYYFQNGCWITNSGPGTATITATFVQ